MMRTSRQGYTDGIGETVITNPHQVLLAGDQKPVMKNSNKKQLLLWANESIFEPFSKRVTEYTMQSNSFSHKRYFVGGFPRSGTTWICRMVAHYLALPWFDMDDPVLGFRGVMHHHWNYHPTLKQSVYVIRDGRDVMVSKYVRKMKGYVARKEDLSDLGKYSPVKGLAYTGGRFASVARQFKHLYGSKFDPWDVEHNMTKYIEYEMQEPSDPGTKSPWPVHVRDWLEHVEVITAVKYEDMLMDPESTLSGLLEDYLDEAPNQEEVSHIVDRFSFKRLTGRSPGEEDRGSFARKGIHGDWRNYFNAASRALFNDYAGDLLIELGYERDDNWVK